jgi:hypothetical protein
MSKENEARVNKGQWCPRLSPVTTNIGATSCFVANVPWRKTKACQLAWQNISPCMMATAVFCSNSSVRISQKTHTIVTNTGCLMFSSTIASCSESHMRWSRWYTIWLFTSVLWTLGFQHLWKEPYTTNISARNRPPPLSSSVTQDDISDLSVL